MVGNLLSPYSYRVGGKSWELGVLTSNQLGFVKSMQVSKKVFASLGPTWSLVDDSLGMFGSGGVEFIHLKWIELRFEVYGAVSVENYNEAGALFGVNIGI